VTQSWQAGVDLRAWVRDALDGLLVEHAERQGGHNGQPEAKTKQKR
jgi:hypothetical protein